MFSVECIWCTYMHGMNPHEHNLHPDTLNLHESCTMKYRIKFHRNGIILMWFWILSWRRKCQVQLCSWAAPYVIVLLFHVGAFSLFDCFRILVSNWLLPLPSSFWFIQVLSYFGGSGLSIIALVFAGAFLKQFLFLHFGHWSRLFFPLFTFLDILLEFYVLPNNFIISIKYFLCFAMCSYIFRRFNSSEDSFSLFGRDS